MSLATPYEPVIIRRSYPQRLMLRVRAALHENPRIWIGGLILLLTVGACVLTLPWTTSVDSSFYYNKFASGNDAKLISQPPSFESLYKSLGTDDRGRSILSRTLLGGVISLAIGLISAALSVVLGVSVGLIAGFRGGWIDSVLMRIVDVLYALPYLLLVIVFKIALDQPLRRMFSAELASLIVMFSAIGLVSWLTMARVIRGQVLVLRGQPFIEACRAVGLPQWRVFLVHVLPNLVGPITVYATLTVPQAILQESFLSFLGIGIDPKLPTWGALASEYRVLSLSQFNPKWWMLAFPCILLALTLLSLNFMGDGLRDLFDPKREASKV